jgi:hypothetical protein
MTSTCLTKSWADREPVFWRILLALLLALGLALSARLPAWAMRSSEIGRANFFSKYTYNGLESDPADASRKTVAFSFRSPHLVERLSLELLQPRAASDFTSDPPATTTRQDARYGFSYHQVVSGLLAAGQTVLSGMGIATAGLAGGELPPWLSLLWGTFSAAGLVGLVKRRTRPGGQRPAGQDPASPAQAEAQPVGSITHCPGCGEGQMVGALYCLNCGSQLMVEMKLVPGSRPQKPAGRRQVRRVGR